MNELVIGSVVRLRSGGPDMTIQAIIGQDCSCQWFSGSELHMGTFALGAVRHADVEGERVRVRGGGPDRPLSSA